MAELTDLPDIIYENEPILFVQSYLELLVDGYTLAFPVEKDQKKLRQAWLSIISKIENEFEEEFVDKVTRKWDNLMKQHKGELNSESPKNLLEKMTGETVLKKKKENLNENSYYARNMDPLKGPKDSVVSPSYYTEQQIEAGDPLPLKELNKQKRKAFKLENVDQFLIFHLAIVRHKLKPDVPLSSLPSIIKERWDEIILSEIKKNISDEFSQKICARWFYYVNQKGIPNTTETLKKILYALLEEQEDKTIISSSTISTKKEVKKGLFRKLFG